MSLHYLEYIVNMKHVPTIKQLKLTNAYKFSDYKFKNIAIQMYQNIVSKKNSDNNLSTVITTVFNGFSLKKAKDILLNISEEHYHKLESKKLESKKLENRVDYEVEYERYLQEQYTRPTNKEKFVITQQDIDNWENL